MVRHPRRALRPGRLAIHPGPRRPIAPPIGLNQPPPRRRFAENKRTTPNLPHRLAGPSARRGRDGAIGWTHLDWSQFLVRRLRKMVDFDSKTNPADPPPGDSVWIRKMAEDEMCPLD